MTRTRWIVGGLCILLAAVYAYRAINESSDLLAEMLGVLEPSLSVMGFLVFGILGGFILGFDRLVAAFLGTQEADTKKRGKNKK